MSFLLPSVPSSEASALFTTVLVRAYLTGAAIGRSASRHVSQQADFQDGTLQLSRLFYRLDGGQNADINWLLGKCLLSALLQPSFIVLLIGQLFCVRATFMAELVY